jgi:flagellar hook assembly protein FlgD
MGTREMDLTAVPNEFSLHQNYPNPFNPVTKIEYDVPGDGNMSLIIYDLMGRQVKTLVSGFQSAGYHEIIWNGINDQQEQVGAGMYLYRMESAGFIKTKKMVLLK